MAIQPTVEDVLVQLNRVSSDLASLSYVLGVFSGNFEHETEPSYSYDINVLMESVVDLHMSIADLTSKMKLSP